MNMSDRVLMGLIFAIFVLGAVGMIWGALVARKQFEIGRRFGRDRYRVEK